MRMLLCILLLSSFTIAGIKINDIKVEQLKQKVLKNNDTLYVVNFWATWCKPCVQELPYFQASANKYKDKKVRTIFVSLNSMKEIADVEKYVANKQIKQEVLLLNETNPNIWINKIDSSWSGSIPATLFYKNGKKLFFREGEFTQHELDSIVQTKL